MSAAQATEARRSLVRSFLHPDHWNTPLEDCAIRLIADNETRAIGEALAGITCTHHTDKDRYECPVCLVTQLRAQLQAADVSRGEMVAICDQLRAQVALDEKAKALMLREHFKDVDEMTALRASVESGKSRIESLEHERTSLAMTEEKLRAEVEAQTAGMMSRQQQVEQLRTEVARLKTALRAVRRDLTETKTDLSRVRDEPGSIYDALECESRAHWANPAVAVIDKALVPNQEPNDSKS